MGRRRLVHGIAGTAVLAIAIGIGQGCSSPDPDPTEAPASDEQALHDSLGAPLSPLLDDFEGRATWIDTYGSVPADCVDHVDALDGARTLFHGCYDWHSSVHAHWAVLRMDLAGTGTHRTLADKIDARLTDEQIERVDQELAAAPQFENPYGRAWLLRLVTEHVAWRKARHGAEPARLLLLGKRIAFELASTFESTPPNPRRSDYTSDSWTVAQLLAFASATNDSSLHESMLRHVRAAYESNPVTWGETNDQSPSSFFSTYWSAAYVIALANTPGRTLELVAPERLPDEALTPLPDPGVASDVHHLGINWSRAWAIKAVARHAITKLGADHATSKRLVRAFQEHVLAGRERHLRYRGNYYAYDHWVPQFAVYAITD